MDKGKVVERESIEEALGCDWETACNICIHEARAPKGDGLRTTMWSPDAVLLFHVVYYSWPEDMGDIEHHNANGMEELINLYNSDMCCLRAEPFAIFVSAPSTLPFVDDTVATHPVWHHDLPEDADRETIDEKMDRLRDDVTVIAQAMTPHEANLLHFLPSSKIRTPTIARSCPFRDINSDPAPTPPHVDPDDYVEIDYSPDQCGSKILGYLNGTLALPSELPVSSQLKHVRCKRAWDHSRQTYKQKAEMTSCSLLEQANTCGVVYWLDEDQIWPLATAPFENLKSEQHERFTRDGKRVCSEVERFTIRFFDPQVLFDKAYVPFLAATPCGPIWCRAMPCCVDSQSEGPYIQPSKWTRCENCGAYLLFFAGDWGVIHLAAFGIDLECPSEASSWAGDIHQSLMDAWDLQQQDTEILREPFSQNADERLILPDPCCPVAVDSIPPTLNDLLEAKAVNRKHGPRQPKKNTGNGRALRQDWVMGMKNLLKMYNDVIECIHNKQHGDPIRCDPAEKARDGQCPVYARPHAYNMWSYHHPETSHREDGHVVGVTGTTDQVTMLLPYQVFGLNIDDPDVPIRTLVAELYENNLNGIENENQLNEYQYMMSCLIQRDFNRYMKPDAPEYLNCFGEAKAAMLANEGQQVVDKNNVDLMDHICMEIFECHATSLDMPEEALQHPIMEGHTPRAANANNPDKIERRLSAHLVCSIRGYDNTLRTRDCEEAVRKNIKERTRSRVGLGLRPERYTHHLKRGFYFSSAAAMVQAQPTDNFTVGNEYLALVFTKEGLGAFLTWQAYTPLIQAGLLLIMLYLIVVALDVYPTVAIIRYLRGKNSTEDPRTESGDSNTNQLPRLLQHGKGGACAARTMRRRGNAQGSSGESDDPVGETSVADDIAYIAPSVAREFAFIMQWLRVKDIRRILKFHNLSTHSYTLKEDLGTLLANSDKFPKISQLRGVADVALKLTQRRELTRTPCEPREHVQEMVAESCLTRRICQDNIQAWSRELHLLKDAEARTP